MLTVNHLFGVRAEDGRPAAAGANALYRLHQRNDCPGCGASQWLVGRVSAECAACATALPLVETGPIAAGLFRRTWEAAEAKSIAA
ncbi:MAG: hypothetical protein ACXWUN_10380 [Allosphingosinicella sp.]